MKKNRKGITIISLIVTIVILLILAGITIGMLIGENGIITEAQHAKLIAEVSDIKEQMEIKQLKTDKDLTRYYQ